MRLVLVGGGHAMLPLLVSAGRLVRQGARVTLVSDAPDLWYSGMTPEWLGGVYGRDDATLDLAAICQPRGVAFHLARAENLDPHARTIALADGARLDYDVAAFDTGAHNPHAEEAGPAIQTKPLHRIEALGAFLDGVAQGAEASPRTLVVVGGGAAGVETALNVTARPDLRGRLRVLVLEPGERILPAMPDGMAQWAESRLASRGARVRTGARVLTADEGGVTLAGGERVGADCVLWATGSEGQPLYARAGLPVDSRGFVRTAPSLRALGHPRVFVAGDAAAVGGLASLARIGVHAVKQGPVLRTNVRRTLSALSRGEPLEALRLRAFRPYLFAPLILSTGEATALVAEGGLWAVGRPVLRLKHLADRRWMARYRARPAPGYATWWDARSAQNRPADAGLAVPHAPG